MNRFLIVRLGALGDVVHAIPVAAALRRAFPAARIDWLVSAKHREILDLVPVIDRRLVVLDGLSSAARALEPSANCARVRRRDRSAGVAEVGARRARFRRAARDRLRGAATPASASRACSTPSRTIPAAAACTIRERPVTSSRSISACSSSSECRRRRRNFRSSRSIRQPRVGCASRRAAAYALLNPGAAWPNKRWPPERFAAVAIASSASGHGLKSIVLWGPGEELLAQQVVDAAGGAAILSPKTTIADIVGADARRGADGFGRHRADAHRRGARHAAGRHLRADASGAQRTAARRTTSRCRATRSASVTICADAGSIGCACWISRSPEVLEAVERRLAAGALRG